MSKGKKISRRNSSVELLRLFAMLLIVLNHVRWPADQIISSDMPYAVRVALMGIVSFCSSFGGVGDCLFFGITAWFLCMEKPTFKKSILRAWSLERQLLFYSYVLFAVDMAAWLEFGVVDYTPRHLAKTILFTVFPFATSRWWYPTSYILFLLIFPWFSEGLRSLGKKNHGILAIVLLALHGILPWTVFRLDMNYCITLFLYLYVLVSFVRWYMPELLTNVVAARKLMLIGFLFGVCSVIGIQLVRPNAQNRIWLNCPTCFPSLFIALGLLICANRYGGFYNQVVNKLASATLGVYLILASEGVADGLSRLQYEMFSGNGIVRIGIITLSAGLLFVFGLIFDLIRQFVFACIFRHDKESIILRIWNNLAHCKWVITIINFLHK